MHEHAEARMRIRNFLCHIGLVSFHCRVLLSVVGVESMAFATMSNFVCDN